MNFPMKDGMTDEAYYSVFRCVPLVVMIGGLILRIVSDAASVARVIPHCEYHIAPSLVVRVQAGHQKNHGAIRPRRNRVAVWC